MFRTIALTGICGPRGRRDDLACAAGARADRQYLFRSGRRVRPGRFRAAAASSSRLDDDDEQVPELPRGRLLPTPNRPPPGQGVPPPGSVQTQPLAPPPGTTVIPQNTAPGIAVAPPQPGRAPHRHRAAAGTAPAHQGRRRAADAGEHAARRRGGVRAAGAEDRQQEGELSPASTRSPGASSISTRISARPSSSARCG